MKVGSDGSLCRITSSIKDSVNNIRIVKLPSDQLKDSEPSYKLVVIGDQDSECDSPSEKSEYEMSDEEISSTIQLPAANLEKEKDANPKVNQAMEMNKLENEGTVKEHYKNKRFRPNHNQSNYSGRRRYNNSRNFPKNYNKVSNISNNEENNYKKFNSSKRNYYNSDNIGVTYNNNTQNIPTNDIEPWINPPSLRTNFSYPVLPVYEPGREPIVQSPINPLPENNPLPSSGKSVGLLGDSPYSSLPTQFPLNQNDSFILDQTYWNKSSEYCSNVSPNMCMPMPSGNKNEYSNYHPSKNPHYHSGDYSRPVHNNALSATTGHKSYYEQCQQPWKNKNRRNPDTWNRNQRNPEKGRRNHTGHFDHRN